MALTNKLTAIADAIRKKTGKTGELTLDAMVTEIGSISGGSSDNELKLIQGTLEKADYPTLTSLGMFAFAGQQNLKEVSLPEVTTIPDFCFYFTPSLNSYDLPKVTTIAGNAFGSSGITSAEFPLVTELGDAAFSECGDLTTVNLPKVTNLSSECFSGAGDITSLNIPLVTELSEGCFASSQIQSFSNENIVTVGRKCFARSAISDVTLNKATTFEEEAFAECNSLTKIALPEGTQFGDGVFQDCNALTDARLSKIESIPRNLFDNCSVLNTLVFSNISSVLSFQTDNIQESFSNTLYLTEESGSITSFVYVPDALVSAFKTDAQWGQISEHIKPLSELPA
jgi:hypothetical protein